MFIALEGADGCGKSTLCAILAKQLGAIPYATPPKKYSDQREEIDKNASDDEHYRFYREGIYSASDEISEMLRRGESVVADRYWLTTYTTHQVMGAEVSKDDFGSIILPTLTVILTLNCEVQIARMNERGMSVCDRRTLDLQQEVVAAFYRNALEFNIPFLAIDTQWFSPETCAKIVAEAIEF